MKSMNCSRISMANDLNRRTMLVATTAVAIAATLPGGSFALTTIEARQLIHRLVGEINQIINSGGTETRMLQEFEGIFLRYGNTKIIARRILGADARTLSPAQFDTFSDAFGVYIARKYGRRFREFVGGEIVVNHAVAVKNWHEVRTTTHLRGRPPMQVDFLVREAGGRNLFFDMVIEGVSLTRIEQEEIGSMLDARGRDISRLSRDLRQP